MAAIIMHVIGNDFSGLWIFKLHTANTMRSMFHAKRLIILPNSSFPLAPQFAGPGQVFHFLHLLSSVQCVEHSYELLQAFRQSFHCCSARNKYFVFKYISLAEQILLQHTSVYSSINLGLHVKINTPRIRINLFYKVACTKHTNSYRQMDIVGMCV